MARWRFRALRGEIQKKTLIYDLKNVTRKKNVVLKTCGKVPLFALVR